MKSVFQMFLEVEDLFSDERSPSSNGRNRSDGITSPPTSPPIEPINGIKKENDIPEEQQESQPPIPPPESDFARWLKLEQLKEEEREGRNRNESFDMPIIHNPALSMLEDTLSVLEAESENLSFIGNKPTKVPSVTLVDAIVTSSHHFPSTDAIKDNVEEIPQKLEEEKASKSDEPSHQITAPSIEPIVPTEDPIKVDDIPQPISIDTSDSIIAETNHNPSDPPADPIHLHTVDPHSPTDASPIPSDPQQEPKEITDLVHPRISQVEFNLKASMDSNSSDDIPGYRAFEDSILVLTSDSSPNEDESYGPGSDAIDIASPPSQDANPLVTSSSYDSGLPPEMLHEKPSRKDSKTFEAPAVMGRPKSTRLTEDQEVKWRKASTVSGKSTRRGMFTDRSQKSILQLESVTARGDSFLNFPRKRSVTKATELPKEEVQVEKEVEKEVEVEKVGTSPLVDEMPVPFQVESSPVQVEKKIQVEEKVQVEERGEVEEKVEDDIIQVEKNLEEKPTEDFQLETVPKVPTGVKTRSPSLFGSPIVTRQDAQEEILTDSELQRRLTSLTRACCIKIFNSTDKQWEISRKFAENCDWVVPPAKKIEPGQRIVFGTSCKIISANSRASVSYMEAESGKVITLEWSAQKGAFRTDKINSEAEFPAKISKHMAFNQFSDISFSIHWEAGRERSFTFGRM
eukprot:TRINITY_DN1653_c0_g1_i6.p1 TRINITY_DN1653_c0_g1~~TRINITY_DN1653_c0_g1_i6.p1  ORF type:complete len:800 (-),score=310.75 TRINITY_DN1653_c0_g1_i6:37-2091(-)